MTRPLRAAAAAAIAVAQVVPGPAAAAELAATGAPSELVHGAFAGARVRMPLGGPGSGRIRAGLALAPTLVGRTGDGVTTRRFADGFELGAARGEPVALRLAGRPIGTGLDARRQRLGVTTFGAAAIVGGVILAGFAVAALALRGDE